MKIKCLLENESITLQNYLSAKGINEIEEFLAPSGDYIEDYHLYNDYSSALSEIKYCYLQNDSHIMIVQDGDVDGICSTFILWQYLLNLKEDWKISILLHTSKQRGLDDEDVMSRIRSEKPNLVIVPDAGTNNNKQSEELYDMGIGLIVLDHHDYITPITKGVLINNQNPLYRVQRNGSGTLVVHKFLYALDAEFHKKWASWFVDIVALSLISDSMDMSELENRTYYHYGLETRECVNNNFLGALIDEFIGDKPYTQRDISFKIVPKLNSICRCQNQELKQRILLALADMDNVKEVLELCKQGHKEQINKVAEIIENNLDKIQELSSNNLIVFASEEIPRSYSGLVCGKVMNLCQGKPSIVGSIKDGYFIGSLRSPIPLRGELDANELVDFASGHEDSCGFGIKEENIQPLVDYYNTLTLSYEPCIEVINSYTLKSIPSTLFSRFDGFDTIWGHDIEAPKLHVTLTYSPQDIKVMGKQQSTLKISQNGTDIVFFFANAAKKQELGLIYEEKSGINENNGEVIVSGGWFPLDSQKRCLEVVGTFGINRYTAKNGKTYETNQIIVEEYEVSPFKAKTLKDFL